MSHEVFCSFCRSRHRVYKKQHVSFINVLLSSLLSGILGVAWFWPEINFKFIVLIPFFLLVAELFIHLRWRCSLICPECGFDPILYKKSPEAASLKVQAKLEKRAQDPNSYLKPPLKIPVKVITPQGEQKTFINGEPELSRLLLLSSFKSKMPNSKKESNLQKSSSSQALTQVESSSSLRTL